MKGWNPQRDKEKQEWISITLAIIDMLHGVQYHEQDEQQDLHGHFTDLKTVSSVTCSYEGAGHQFKTAAS